MHAVTCACNAFVRHSNRRDVRHRFCDRDERVANAGAAMACKAGDHTQPQRTAMPLVRREHAQMHAVTSAAPQGW